MEIELIQPPCVPFSQVPIGEVFYYAQTPHIKLCEILCGNSTINAWSLSELEYETFSHDTMVTPIKCKLVQIR